EEKFDLTSIFEGSVYSNYIKNEKVKYDREELTRSCLDGKCNGCDICKNDVKNIVSKKYNEEEIFNELQNISKNFNYDNLIRTDKKKSYLLKFSKFNQYRYVGHLDFYRTFIRILKIAGIDFEYSQGFNPMPKVFFPFPSSLGMESFEDLLLFESYNEIIDKEYFCKSYNLFLPDGFKFEKIIEIESIKSWRNNANIKQFLIIPFEIKIFDNSRLKVLEKFLNNKVFLILGEKSKKILLEKKIKVLEDEIDINIENDNQNVVQSINGKLKIKTELKENQANIVKLLNAYEEEERFFTQEINISFSNFVKRYINIE
ncbi:MAG: TIGR03936 family radical SAM-associated protein, partial [Spirochaetota bacterium]